MCEMNPIGKLMEYLTPRSLDRWSGRLTGDVHVPVRMASSKKIWATKKRSLRVFVPGVGTTGHDESLLVKQIVGLDERRTVRRKKKTIWLIY